MSYDVRAVANAILDLAQERNKGVTNLSINKIIYFLHAAFLHEYQRPLISAKIEAWDHGPVFREIYHQFKKFGRGNITELARRLDAATGSFVIVRETFDETVANFINCRAAELLNLSPGKLVNMSHVTDDPWYAARYAEGRINPGVEITDDLILSSGTRGVTH